MKLNNAPVVRVYSLEGRHYPGLGKQNKYIVSVDDVQFYQVNAKNKQSAIAIVLGKIGENGEPKGPRPPIPGIGLTKSAKRISEISRSIISREKASRLIERGTAELVFQEVVPLSSLKICDYEIHRKAKNLRKRNKRIRFRMKR